MKKIVISTLGIALIMLSSCWSTNQEKVQPTPTRPATFQTGAALGNTGVTPSDIVTKPEVTTPDIVPQSPVDSGSTTSNSSTSPEPIVNTPVATPTPTTITDSSSGSVLTSEDEQGIVAAFVQKAPESYSGSQDTMKVSAETFADGKFFKGQITTGSRTMLDVFAIKKENTWKVVSFGQSTPPCAWVNSYAFPVSIIPECSLEDGTTQTR